MAELAGADIFDHRGGEVDGRNFTQWFINEYMISTETLFHKDPATGKPQVRVRVQLIGHARNSM